MKFPVVVYCLFVWISIQLNAQQNATLSNQEYAMQCRNDGWNVELLNTAANADYLTDEEKNLVLATNMVRTDPPKFAELYVSEVIGYYQGRLLKYPFEIPIETQEGKAPAVQVYRILLKTKPMGILYPSAGMSRAARDHAESLSVSGRIGHGSGNAPAKRLQKFGKWTGCMGENISYGPETGYRVLIALLIDDGVSARGHRKVILEERFTRIGVGSAPHKRYGKSFVVTYACDYADAAS